MCVCVCVRMCMLHLCRLDSKERVRFKIKTTEKEARKDQTIVKGQENDALCNMRTWLPPVSVQERKVSF